jgi:hypothetical protein
MACARWSATGDGEWSMVIMSGKKSTMFGRLYGILAAVIFTLQYHCRPFHWPVADQRAQANGNAPRSEAMKGVG